MFFHSCVQKYIMQVHEMSDICRAKKDLESLMRYISEKIYENTLTVQRNTVTKV